MRNCFVNTCLLCISLIVFFSASFTMIKPVWSETINSALAAAYNNNPTLNSQRAATRAADESIAIAKSGYRPTITANANLGLSQTRTSIGGFTNESNLTPHGFGVVINQTLWDSYLTRNTVEAALAAVRASQEALRNAEQNILFNAASAYMDVVRDRQILNHQNKTLAFLKEEVRSERARFEVGEATRTDVSQAEASLANAVANVALAKANLNSSEAIYRQIIGHKPGKLAAVKGIKGKYPSAQNAGMSIALKEHPAVRAAEFIVDQAIFNVKAAESGLLPRVDLQAGSSRTFDSTVNDSDAVSSSVTATLSVPIYQAGRQAATIRQNKERLGQNRIQVDESVDSVRAAVVSAYSQYEGAVTALNATRAQVDAARLALNSIVEERNVGERTTLDVLQTQNQLIAAQIELASRERDVIVAGYAILSSIGRLNAGHLNLKVAHYNPKAHKEAVEDKWFGLRIPSGN